LQNYKRTKEWLNLAFNNLEKVVKFFKISEYDACVFRIQLSMEQLQKALIFLFGVQIRKTHEASKILDSLIYNKKLEMEEEIIIKLKELSKLAKPIEKETTMTRYGVIRDEKLIPPEKLYKKSNTKDFIAKMIKFLTLYRDLLNNLSELSRHVEILDEYIGKIKNLIGDGNIA
jgi:HEPN domain-containing protein